MRRGLIYGVCAGVLMLASMSGAFAQNRQQHSAPPKFKGDPLAPAKALSPKRPQSAKPTVETVYFKGKLLSETQEMLSDVVLQDVVNQLWKQADAHGHEGEYNHFINISRILMLSNPHEFEPFDTSAHLLWSTDRVDEGLKVLKQGLEANPNNYYFYDEIGMHYVIRVKDYKAAIPYYEKAIVLKCPWSSYNILATCYEKTGQPEKAIAILEKAAIYPENKVGQRRLRVMLEKYKGVKRGSSTP
ncbi:MAG: hypothetical protein NT023_07365 [Armatimonadetes bacterium]|nr:hypothetical protein [Armatimonadota bacterium]